MLQGSEPPPVDPLAGMADAAAAGPAGQKSSAGARKASTAKGPAPPAAAAPAAAPAVKGPFLLHPPSLDLGLGEGGELCVVAMPEVEGLQEDVIMCR
jgi:hypothetical protein